MLFFVFLNHKCNLTCRYCGETTHPITSMSNEVNYSIDELISFLAKDSNPIIAFYGGEPLLNLSLMEEIMDKLPDACFVVQTNGTNLHKVKSTILTRIHSILVSIDGNQNITDYYRGQGTFQKITRNMSIIRQKGFDGDLIARMTISSKSDIYRDVHDLISIKNPSFDHIHWQLDVIWNDENQWGDFEKWINESYNPGITKLINEWVEEMTRNGSVQGIIPFLGIMKTLLIDTPSKLRCGAGIDAFAIQTNGEIFACPVCPEFEEFKVGNILADEPDGIYNSLPVISPCLECEILKICGGRCLFANRHNLWGESFKLVCKTVQHLITELNRIKPKIEELSRRNIISIDSFNYPQFNNSCEIIP